MPRPELRWPGRTAWAATAAGVPSAPSSVTSITKDAGATLSFIAPASSGSGGPVTSYAATPYIAGVAQAPVTTAVGSAGSITGSNGNSYVQIPAGTLTNGTAYTFSVHASNAAGAGAESGQSGANTPLSGLVFGDDFNGPSGGPVDPEWWVYSRCGYIAQSEIQWYLPSQVSLDGSSNLLLTATKTAHSGVSYPSDGNTVRNQSWLSGACQSNTRTYQPAAGNTMTFEARQQTCPDVPNGMWPGLFWLEGQINLTAWKTDPLQSGWDNGSSSEMDIAEFKPSYGNLTTYGDNVFGNTTDLFDSNNPGTDFSAAMHIFQGRWKPGVSVTFFRDGTQVHQVTTSGIVATTACSYFLLLYLQILAGSATATQSCKVDYVRVYDQNLG